MPALKLDLQYLITGWQGYPLWFAYMLIDVYAVIPFFIKIKEWLVSYDYKIYATMCIKLLLSIAFLFILS